MVNYFLGIIFNLNRQHERAVEAAVEAEKRALELDPAMTQAAAELFWSRYYFGHYEQALRELDGFGTRSTDPRRPVLHRALALWHLGKSEEALEIYRRFSESAAKRYLAPVWQAVGETVFGDKEKALDLLEQSHRNRDGIMVMVKAGPLSDPLRSHLRFQAIHAEHVAVTKLSGN